MLESWNTVFMCVSNYSYPTSGSDIKSTTMYHHVPTYSLLRPVILHAVPFLVGCLLHHFCIQVGLSNPLLQGMGSKSCLTLWPQQKETKIHFD